MRHESFPREVTVVITDHVLTLSSMELALLAAMSGNTSTSTVVRYALSSGRLSAEDAGAYQGDLIHDLAALLPACPKDTI